MRLLSSFVLVLLFGCISFNPPIDHSIPQILIQQPLPPLPDTFNEPSIHLKLALFIIEDGSVNMAFMRKGSGNPDWDSTALKIIYHWKFIPAIQNHQPVKSWYYLHTHVRFASPIYMVLAEVRCMTNEQADSIYRELRLGKSLADLQTSCRIDTLQQGTNPSSGVNIYQYPTRIRDELMKLSVDECSPPLEYGDRYVIFQRLHPQ
jgi:hypothetical protein